MTYLFEECVVDTDRRELRRRGNLIPLEPKVFDLLVHLIEQRQRVMSKDDLLASLWDGRIVSESALSTCINAARSAIGDSGEEHRLIKTLPRKGVRFVAEVREERAQTRAAVAEVGSELPTPQFSLPDRPSIAVLPFTNMSGHSEQNYFADGMAEEIITALSRCAGLFVIARNSSFTYRGRTVDVRQVGRELGVRYVIEGSVRRSGNRLRFAGQLIDATTGAHIWADRFDGDLSDVFALQDRFTESVVAAIGPQIPLAEIGRLRHKTSTLIPGLRSRRSARERCSWMRRVGDVTRRDCGLRDYRSDWPIDSRSQRSACSSDSPELAATRPATMRARRDSAIVLSLKERGKKCRYLFVHKTSGWKRPSF